MNANLAALAYLASGVLFILTLRGLSSPVTSRRGNQMGMIGMALAIATALAQGVSVLRNGRAWDGVERRKTPPDGQARR